MVDDEERIRQEAHKLWVSEGCPEGRAERHWTEAKEIVALRDSFGSTLRPLRETTEDPVEPAIAFQNQADLPGLDDLGEGAGGPSWDNVRENADVHPLAVEDAAPAAPRGSDPAR